MFVIIGTYAFKKPFPMVGGNEGVGVVKEVGSNVKTFKRGDMVLPLVTSALGTQHTITSIMYCIS